MRSQGISRYGIDPVWSEFLGFSTKSFKNDLLITSKFGQYHVCWWPGSWYQQPWYWLHEMELNSLWPSDAIWWQRSGSTLNQVMACCLSAPSHYLNQYWLIIKAVLWHSLVSNFARSAHEFNQQPVFGDSTFKITTTSPRSQWAQGESQKPVTYECWGTI